MTLQAGSICGVAVGERLVQNDQLRLTDIAPALAPWRLTCLPYRK